MTRNGLCESNEVTGNPLSSVFMRSVANVTLLPTKQQCQFNYISHAVSHRPRCVEASLLFSLLIIVFVLLGNIHNNKCKCTVTPLILKDSTGTCKRHLSFKRKNS